MLNLELQARKSCGNLWAQSFHPQVSWKRGGHSARVSRMMAVEPLVESLLLPLPLGLWSATDPHHLPPGDSEAPTKCTPSESADQPSPSWLSVGTSCSLQLKEADVADLGKIRGVIGLAAWSIG